MQQQGRGEPPGPGKPDPALQRPTGIRETPSAYRTELTPSRSFGIFPACRVGTAGGAGRRRAVGAVGAVGAAGETGAAAGASRFIGAHMTTTSLNLQSLAGAVLTVATVLSVFIVSLLNIRTARGPKERRFLLQVTPLLWVVVISFVGLLYWLQSWPSRITVLISYFVIAPVFMYRASRRRLLIRKLESRNGNSARADVATG